MGKYLLETTQDTVFKLQPVDSSTLAPDQLFRVAKGTNYALEAIDVDLRTNHAKIILSHPLPIGSPIYTFIPHVQVWDISGKTKVLLDEIKPVDTPPTPPTPTAVTTSSTKPNKRAFKMPWYQSTFYFEDPITPNSPLSWGEMLHNGTRMPQQKAHVENMIKLSRQLTPYRIKLGKPFIITSGYRPEPFNSRVGGARNSVHLRGGAVDFRVNGMSRFQLARFMESWNGGLGIYNNQGDIVHVDIEGRRRWGF
jgi:hypothetical protein